MQTALVPATTNDPARQLEEEFGPLTRGLAERYFSPVRFPAETEERLRALHETGFVVHVMRSTAWLNYMYLDWALVKRGLPPVRAVVNLRPWISRPWKHTAQRGDLDVRFTYARRQGGSGLIFLKMAHFLSAHGRDYLREDPFPTLVKMARRSEKTVWLVPELFVWEKWTARLKPGWMDYVFGSPEAPNFLHSMVAFWRNYHRAQFRVGEPIDLRKFAEEHPEDSDEVVARKVRGALHHHLARETRAVFGPPYKTTDRLIDETLRDRTLRRTVEAHAESTRRRPESVQREVRRNLQSIAARVHPSAVGISAPLLSLIFERIYDGIEVDEKGLERAMAVAAKAPIVLCPSHKSHVDYLVLSWTLWNRGYNVPHVAAGANLSFWPLGPYLRRNGAFFLRRSFKGDPLYTASFKAYVKKLVHDGVHQEFFPEGGRSRTGKLLPAKLGLFTWEVDAILEGAHNDLYFIPVAIDYAKVMEGGSYTKELAGGEKKPEDFRALLTAPRVLTRQYGRIHLTFDEPVSLVELMKARGLSPDVPPNDEQKKGLVRALGNRVMYGISRVSTVTPQALASAALLAHRRRGATARELTDRIVLLRKIAEEEGNPLAVTLRNAPSDPTVMGAVQDAVRGFCSDGWVKTQTVKGQVIYQADDEHRAQMSFPKNTLMNMVAGRALVATALLVEQPAPLEEVKARALFLSRLFKVEFIYRVGATFDSIFEDTVERLERMGLVEREAGRLQVARSPHAEADLAFLSDLLRDLLEGYLLAFVTLEDAAAAGGLDKKAFIKAALETGRADYLAGRLSAPESLNRTNLENAVVYLLDQKLLVEEDKKLKPGPAAQTPEERKRLVAEVRRYLER